jgi:hypothetical protein
MTSQGLVPIPLVQVPRVGGVTLPRTSVFRAILALARLTLAALVVLMMIAATAVATGRTEIPLQALAAVRGSGTFPAAPAGPPPVRSVAAPVLKVGTVMNLPLGGVGTDARTRSAAVVDAIEARLAAERAAAAARAAERRAAAQRAARLAAQRAAAQREAARQAAAAEAAQQAAAERAAEQAAARRAAARQAAAAEAAEEAAAERAAARQAAQQETAQEDDTDSTGLRQVSNAGSSGEG